MLALEHESGFPAIPLGPSPDTCTFFRRPASFGRYLVMDPRDLRFEHRPPPGSWIFAFWTDPWTPGSKGVEVDDEEVIRALGRAIADPSSTPPHLSWDRASDVSAAQREIQRLRARPCAICHEDVGAQDQQRYCSSCSAPVHAPCLASWRKAAGASSCFICHR